MQMSHLPEIPELMHNRSVFCRESGSNLYGAEAYFLVSNAISTLISCVQSLLFVSIVYFMVGFQNTAESFGFFFFFLLFASLIAEFNAKFLAAISSKSQNAVSLFTFSIIFAIFFSGYMVYVPRLPTWLSPWSTYLNFGRFIFQGLVLNEFQGNGKLPNEKLYIEQLGFEDISKQQCALYTIVFFIFFFVASFLALKFFNHEVR
jgi:hypothetical protein